MPQQIEPPKSSPAIKRETKLMQGKIDRIFLLALMFLMLIGLSVVAIPNVYQMYMLASDTDDWFSVNQFVVYDDGHEGPQRFKIDRTINTIEPLTVTIMWTIKDAGTNEILCERELFTVWEKTDVIDSVVRNVVRQCEDAPQWVGRKVKIQGRFSVVLHYGIRKEQTATSNVFVYTGK